jgi:hypothetical protein
VIHRLEICSVIAVFLLAAVFGAYTLFHGHGVTRGPQLVWTPMTALPLSDAIAASYVIRRVEQRPGNEAVNNYVPTAAQLSAFYAAMPKGLNDPLRKYVTGNSHLTNPSTDDLIQWTAHKWGIPEDWIRAEAVLESHWTQTPVKVGYGLGDQKVVSGADYAKYPKSADVPGKPLTVYQSMGIMQSKWLANQPTAIAAGTEPLRWESTAFNLDWYGHYVRWLYDGYTTGISWIPNISKGNKWQSIGGWFGGGGGSVATRAYIASVRKILVSKPWTQPGF